MKTITSFKLCAVLFLGSLLTAGAQKCTVRQRKEIRTLSKAERDAFFAALVKLQTGTRPTTYDRFTNYHLTYRDQTHGTPLFFSWHRNFLREFEKALQNINPTITLPYWDWSIDSQAPETSVVFTPDYYGGNGGGSNGCVQDGPFKNWKPSYPDSHCLTRQFDKGNQMSSFYGPESINNAIQTSNRYDDLRKTVEGVFHGTIHVAVGGDMAVMQSPNDPIFYAHHCFVDKIWANWQTAHPDRAKDYNGVNAAGQQVKPSDVIPPWNTKVSEILDTTDLCYTYNELKDSDIKQPALPAPQVNNNATGALPTNSTKNNTQGGAEASNSSVPSNVTVTPASNSTNSNDTAPKADDRQDLLNIRVPPSLPDAWCKLNRLNTAGVRSSEAKHKKLCQDLNSLEGYVSPCALWNREDLLSKLITKVPNFTAIVGGKKVVVGHSAANPLQAVSNVKAKVSVVYGSTAVATPNQVAGALEKLIGPPAVKAADAVSNVFQQAPRNVPSDYLPSLPSTPAAPAASVSPDSSEAPAPSVSPDSSKAPDCENGAEDDNNDKKPDSGAEANNDESPAPAPASNYSSPAPDSSGY